MRALYKPGDEVLKPVEVAVAEMDSEDERLVAEVRQLSMVGHVSGSSGHHRPRSSDRRRQHEHSASRQRRGSAQLTDEMLRQNDRSQPQIEHQPSLRSLLSAEDAVPRDVQAEILRSIYAEGVLDGIDLDNLTPQQEEELTDRIAEAYRRRQQQPRERSGNRSQASRHSRSQNAGSAAAPQPDSSGSQSEARLNQQATRSRPPISRPHLFEQGLQEPSASQQRSASATSQRSARAMPRTSEAAPAARSATDLSQHPTSDGTHRPQHSRVSSTRRSVTDPQSGITREHIRRVRADSNRDPPPSSRRDEQSDIANQQFSYPDHTIDGTTGTTVSPRSLDGQHSVRPAASMAAFAPEAVTSRSGPSDVPAVDCARCGRHNIGYELHYNCSRCANGNFNICQTCYRAERGCDHWFGFGFRAMDRWSRRYPKEPYVRYPGYPHVLTPTRFIRPTPPANGDGSQSNVQIQQGAFCDSCIAFAADDYWYCTEYCLEGAWGYCHQCVGQGKHCSHALLPLTHSSLAGWARDQTGKAPRVELPHLEDHFAGRATRDYVAIERDTDCDVCRRTIPPDRTWFHCYLCREGQHDVCNDCYRGLVAQGKISQGNGPEGWRRCLQGHRMAIVGRQKRNDGAYVWIVVSEMVGGWDFKEDDGSRSGQLPSSGQMPPPGGTGMRCLALYSHFPDESAADELAFPKNAVLTEIKDLQNEDWFLGVYAGQVKLVPRNHVRMI